MTTEIATNYHLNPNRCALPSDRNIRIRGGVQPDRNDISNRVQEISCNLIEDLTFVRNRPRKYMIKCRNSVRSNRNKNVISGKYIPYFTLISGDAIG